MGKHAVIKYGVLLMSGMAVLAVIGGIVFGISAGVIGLGYLLAFVVTHIFQGPIPHDFVLVVLAVGCTAGLGLPILILARNIQRSNENFSLLQFDEENEDEDAEFDDEDDAEESDDSAELNEFLSKLHKTRNIGPFIPSPKTMDDICPCGSGLKYKDCCGKFWS